MKTWDITRTLYKVSDFLSWQKAKNLVLSPSFQRRSVWKHGAKSYLLDTIVRGLPIPIIFLRERQTSPDDLEPIREVVDGQQRIRTVISYIAPNLLKDLNKERDIFQVKSVHNKELANKYFVDLSDDFKRKILDYQFSVHVLPPGIDDREILQIFARMNSTGVKLNSQELRNALFFGEFKTCMYLLGFEQLPRWREWNIFTEDQISRMNEVELTSEIAILMLQGISGKSQARIDKIYEINDESFPERKECERRFNIIMDTIEDKFGNELRKMVFRKVSLFYILFAYIYDTQYGLGSSLLEKLSPKLFTKEKSKKIILASQNLERRTAPENVLDATDRRTTHVISRKDIFNYVKKVS
jgi:uncharacterized protein with ParB-like and HNH nuclease domain